MLVVSKSAVLGDTVFRFSFVFLLFFIYLFSSFDLFCFKLRLFFFFLSAEHLYFLDVQMYSLYSLFLGAGFSVLLFYMFFLLKVAVLFYLI